MTFIDQNRNQHLNPEFNAWLTHCVNVLQRRLTLKEKNFLKRCYNINVISGIPLIYDDFKEMWKSNYQGNFRAIKLKLSPLFEVVRKGKPTYYKLNGLYLDKELTDEYTGIPISERIFANLNILLSMCRHEIPQIHNIVFSFTTSGFYDRLLRLDYKTTKNKIILLNDIRIHNKIDIKAEVYSTGKVILHLACTYNPIDYTANGFIQLISLLGQVYHSLKHDIAHLGFDIEPTHNWIFSHVDLNKDSISYDFPTKDYTVRMVFGHVQVYNKTFPDKKQRIRVEEQLELDNTIEEELSSVRYQKASELQREDKEV